MHVVAIDRVTGDLAAAARALADLTGRTPYECRPRVQVPGGGPAVISTHPDAAAANAFAGQVRAAGFHPTVLDAAAEKARLRACSAHGFSLDGDALELADRHGRAVAIPYDTIDRLVRGTAVSQTRHTETTKERSLSVGRAILSGGLVMSRTKSVEHTSTTTSSTGFLAVYAGAELVWLAENELDYRSLGSAMQPARAANFLRVVGEIRSRGSAASWDDRLLHVAAQRQVLGPTLDAEHDLEIAVALVAASLGPHGG